MGKMKFIRKFIILYSYINIFFKKTGFSNGLQSIKKLLIHPPRLITSYIFIVTIRLFKKTVTMNVCKIQNLLVHFTKKKY